MFMRRRQPGSYVGCGNELIAERKTPEAMELIERGLQHYSGKIIDAISPYAKADAGLIVFALRHLADEVEKGNPGARELAEGMKECVSEPAITEVGIVRRGRC